MKTGVQSLVNDVVGYGMGSAVNRAIGLAVSLVYPIFPNRDEYGRMDVIYSVPYLLTVFFLFGFDSTLARFFYAQDEILSQRRLVSTAFHTVSGLSLLIVGILLLTARPLALALYKDPRYTLCFRLVVAAMPFVVAGHLNLAVLRLERRVHLHNLVVAFNQIVSALIGIGSFLLLFRALTVHDRRLICKGIASALVSSGHRLEFRREEPHADSD